MRLSSFQKLTNDNGRGILRKQDTFLCRKNRSHPYRAGITRMKIPFFDRNYTIRQICVIFNKMNCFLL